MSLNFETKLDDPAFIRVPKHLQEIVRKALGKHIVVTLKVWRRKRTDKQNAWYWVGIVEPIKNALWELGERLDQKEVHRFLKRHVGKLSTYKHIGTMSVTEKLNLIGAALQKRTGEVIVEDQVLHEIASLMDDMIEQEGETKNMTTDQFMDYAENCCMFAVKELSVMIDLPQQRVSSMKAIENNGQPEGKNG